MLDNFKNHQHLNYFFLYAISFAAYGACISGLGPFIPYLSAQTGLIQTQYSFLFSCRSFAMVTGCLITKYLQKIEISNHNIAILGSVIIAIFSSLFTYSRSSFWLGIWCFITSVGYTILEVMVNVCVLLINNPEEIQFWMLLTHGLFGIGGLIGPVLVYFFQGRAFGVFGLLIAVVIPFYFKIKSPQLNGFQPQHMSSPSSKAKTITPKLEFWLCAMMFLYQGLECTYGGWISSFAVLTGVTDNNGATIFPIIFWVLMTIFRISLAFLPGKSSKKLQILIMSNILSGVITMLIIYADHAKFACYLSGAMFGFSMSSLYPLTMTLPLQKGLNLEDNQTANILMAGVVAEGVLTMFVGWLMSWIHPNMLFYSLSFFGLLMWFIRLYCLHLIDKQLEEVDKNGMGEELQLKVKESV